MDFDWKTIVKGIAPTIGAALGGPLAGTATQFIAEKLIGDSKATEIDVSSFLKVASPEQLFQLKKLDAEFQEKMKSLDVDVFSIRFQEMQSAREMQSKTGSKIVPGIAGFTVFGFFMIVAWILSGQVGLDNTLIGLVLGQISAKAEQIYNFYFGSSLGSKQKTERLGAKE